jgi:hypothetical protein
VVSSATAHADFLAASADCLLPESISSSDIVHAAVPWAPSQIRVHVYVDVHFKAHILLKDIFRPELLDVVFFELDSTPMLHARDLDHLAVKDVGFQMV